MVIADVRARALRIDVQDGHGLNRGSTIFFGHRCAGWRLQEMGELAGGLEYPAVNAAIARFEQRLKIYRELQKKIKKVAKELNIEI